MGLHQRLRSGEALAGAKMVRIQIEGRSVSSKFNW